MLRALCTKRRGPWSAKDEKRAWRPCSPKKMSPQCHWACIWCVEDEMVCFTENAKLPSWEASSGHHYVHGASWESHLRDLEFDKCYRDENYMPGNLQPLPTGHVSNIVVGEMRPWKQLVRRLLMDWWRIKYSFTYYLMSLWWLVHILGDMCMYVCKTDG